MCAPHVSKDNINNWRFNFLFTPWTSECFMYIHIWSAVLFYIFYFTFLCIVIIISSVHFFSLLKFYEFAHSFTYVTLATYECKTYRLINRAKDIRHTNEQWYWVRISRNIYIYKKNTSIHIIKETNEPKKKKTRREKQ